MANQINLNNTIPSAPIGGQNVLWQSDASSPTNVSAYINFSQGLPGQVLTTDGANPQHLSWSNAEIQPRVFYALSYGVLADTLSVTGCTGTSGQSVITCTGAAANFVSSDVGKIVWASGSANSTPDLPQGTIISVTNSQTIVVSTTLIRNLTAGELVYGHDDTAALNDAWAALIASPNCGTLVLPGAGMIITAGVMNANLPSHCLFDQAAIGATIIGLGPQTTIFYPAPNFTYYSTSNCSNPATAAYGCFGPSQANIRQLEFYGGYGGNLVATNTFNGCWLAINSPGNVFNVVLQSYIVPGTMQSVCFISGNSWAKDLQIFGFGGNGNSGNCTALFIISDVTSIFNSYISGTCNQDGSNMIMNASLGTLDLYSMSGSAAVQNPWLCKAGVTKFYGGMGFGGQTTGGIKATGSGTIVDLMGVYNTTTNVAYASLLTVALGAVMSASQSVMVNSAVTGSGYAVTVDSTSKFIDIGGNTLSAHLGTANITSGGLFIPDVGATYIGNQSLPGATGTGACGTITTQVGNMFSGTLKCTGVTGASTIVLTPGLTAANGWNCTGSDLTTNTNLLNQSGSSQTTCTLSASAIATNDVITFRLTQF